MRCSANVLGACETTKVLNGCVRCGGWPETGLARCVLPLQVLLFTSLELD